jgi:hypothetical protein
MYRLDSQNEAEEGDSFDRTKTGAHLTFCADGTTLAWGTEYDLQESRTCILCVLGASSTLQFSKG